MEQLTRPWSAQTLRFTAFLQPPAEQIPQDEWERATGETPAIDQVQPRQLFREQGGPIDPGYLSLQFQGLAGRLDWIMVPAPPVLTEAVPPFEFGPVEPALSAFNRVVRKWLITAQITSNRLAIGVAAVIPMPDRVTAYKALQEYLPSVKIDAEHSRDLSYAINRPKASRSLGPEVELNRITRWSALQIQVSGVAGPVSGIGGVYTRVECDHNTPAERQSPLDNSRFGDIYDELIEMALQNLESGELP